MRVQLARMEGKLDLSNLKHDQTDKRLDNHEQRLHRHANDISTLQANEHRRTGERQGLAMGGKALWAGIGFTPPAIVALLKLFGL